MLNKPIKTLAVLLFFAVVLGPLYAAPVVIPLPGTGQNDSGNPGHDLNYQLVGAPAAYGGATNVGAFLVDLTTTYTDPGGHTFNPLWTPGGWIGADSNYWTVMPAGTYIFMLQFDLTGYLPNTAVLSGRWITDNTGTNIYINQTATGNQNLDPAAFLGNWANFSINSGFVAGVNRLYFYVNNAQGPLANPVGLLVDNLQVSAEAVPEPAAFFLLGVGLIAVAAVARRKRQS